MKKLMSLLALLFAFTLIASACGGSSDDTSSEDEDTESTNEGDEVEDSSDDSDDGDTEESSDDGEVALTQSGDLTFHMITHADDGPFWSVLKRGAEAAAADTGVTLVWQGSNNDPEKQVQDIEAAIAAGSNGIAASLASPDQVAPALTKATGEGIPVYTLNSGVNQYKDIGAVTHIGQTETVAGEGAGERFNDLGATKVLCAFQEESNVGLEERCAGLEATFNGEVITEFGGLDADQTEQINTINGILSANPDIDGVLGTGPVVVMSALQASNDLGRDMYLGGFDMTPDLLTAIEDGDIDFTVDQQQYLQGYLPIVLMYLQATNQNTAGGGLPILTGPGFVTPDNAGEVKALSEAGTR